MLISAADAKIKLRLTWPGNFPIFMADKMYSLVSKEWLKKKLLTTFIEKYQYIPEIFDCDDYVDVLNGYVKQEQYYEKPLAPYALGIIWGEFHDIKDHARIVTILEDGKVYAVEPQNDTYYPVSFRGTIIFIKM